MSDWKVYQYSNCEIDSTPECIATFDTLAECFSLCIDHEIVTVSQEIAQEQHGSIDTVEQYMIPSEDEYDVVYISYYYDEHDECNGYDNIIFATKNELSNISFFT